MFKEVSRVSQGSFKGASKKIKMQFKGCFKGVSNGLKEVLRNCQVCFRKMSKFFKGVSKMFQ